MAKSAAAAVIGVKQTYDGEWFPPRLKGYLLTCCDCGLTHRVDFRTVGAVAGGGRAGYPNGVMQLQMRVRRLKGLTSRIRRMERIQVVQMAGKAGSKGASNRRPNTRKSSKTLTGVARREERAATRGTRKGGSAPVGRGGRGH